MGEVIDEFRKAHAETQSRENSNICNRSNKTKSSIGIPSDLDERIQAPETVMGAPTIA